VRVRHPASVGRPKGIEQYALEKGHRGFFLTITAPGRMHPRHQKTGAPNQNHDGTNPRQAQNYLNRVWRTAMRSAQHQGLTAYGLRVVEPHHDACPHWHALVFTAPDAANQLIATLRAYAMADSANEPGAAERRFVVKEIDDSKGSAVGYVAKYVSKSIDGEGVDSDSETACTGTNAAKHIVAWARMWGIRQFQFFGLPAITPTRELYRHDGTGLGSHALTAAHTAAKANDYAAWLRACDLHGLRFRVDYSERKSTRYADEMARAIRGLKVQALDLLAPADIVTRTEVWSIQARPTGRGEAVAGVPWTRFNNCAPLDSIDLLEHEDARPIPAGQSRKAKYREEGKRGVLHRAPLPDAGRGDGDRPGREHSDGLRMCKKQPPEARPSDLRGPSCSS